jgi:cysteine desulfurase
MIYLDYSATTPVNEVVLTNFIKFNQEFFANPNSTHSLGKNAELEIEETTNLISRILNVTDHEVIYTSGATEANNLAIKGFAFSNSYKGRHIITGPYEHSSVTSCLNYLAKEGFEIDVLGIKESGLVDLDELEELIRDDTILVSLSLVNSELGIIQDTKRIKDIFKKHNHVKFHSDLTQAIGKVEIPIEHIDLISFSGHKIYGLKGIGALLRRRSISLTPVIHGGKSTSIYRGGTPSTPLINSLGKTLELAYEDLPNKIKKIAELKRYLISEIEANIKEYNFNYLASIPQINNISFTNIEANIMQKKLSKKEIYVSTQTACSSESSFSQTVKKITGSDTFAKTSIRISLSHLTSRKEIDILVKAIKEIIHENS